FKRAKGQFLTAKATAKRLQRAQSLLRRHAGDHMLFSDEKKWTVEEVHNPQNHRIYARSKELAVQNPKYIVSKSHSPASVNVWAAISTKGKFALVFLENDRLTGKKYLNQILKK